MDPEYKKYGQLVSLDQANYSPLHADVRDLVKFLA